ncbi:MAG: 4Fe-4S dicluster domain-containing protein [Desulfobacterales bacterium]
MDIKRRQFLKIAGLSTIAGLGAPAAFNLLLKGGPDAVSYASSGGEAEASHEAAPTGVRLGMVIDQRVFDANKGLAQKCTTACHTVHNVPNFGNKKDEIKWIFEVPFEKAFTGKSQYHKNKNLEDSSFLVLCNHCDNPPCVRACPTKATFKRKDGIVAMDYHRCIGCRFCMAACPYGMRSFNWRDPRPFIDQKTHNKEFPTRMRGVVEKCNFCVDRLARGQQPACVEACGNTGAMTFGDLNDSHSEIVKLLDINFTIQRKPSLGTNPSVFYIV